MKKKKKVLLFVLVILFCLVFGTTAFARYNQVDLYGSLDPETQRTTYTGNMTVVTNTNFEIGNDDEFNNSLATGAPEPEAAPSAALENTLGITDTFKTCGTLQLDQHQVDRDKMVLKAEDPETPAASYVVDEKKMVKIVTGVDADGNQITKEQEIICKAVGTNCTVWYTSDSGKTTEDGREMAAVFDGFHQKMLSAFGDPAPIDVDRDGRVAVVVADLQDFAAGYFWSEDLKDENSPTGNQMDMVNLNQIITD
ncbi:MAG: hypothetical protein RR614_10210, partial [Eubacterium sp.]